MNLKNYLKPLAITASLLVTAPIFAANSDEFVLNLKDPQYENGVVKTENGGVITAPDLRIQGQNLTYINTKEEHKILASGDLMMEYHGRIFVGDTLEFDLRTCTGHLTGGRTNEGSWYIGGDRIELCADGSFTIYGAFITTSVGQDNPWKITARYGKVTNSVLSAKDVRFLVLKFPLLWLPAYSSNLSKFKDPPIRYRILWDKGLGPRLSLRYRFFATETFSAFARFDYRITRGPGGSLEADYLSKNKRTLFQAKNYGALDKIFPNEKGSVRYRFQGIYKTKSEDEYSRFHVQWDKLRDSRMVSDFRDPDFEINTQKTTYLEASHYQDWAFGTLSVRPKINTFQSLNEELPYSSFGLHPFEIWRTGVIMENYANGSYLDYNFSTQLDSSEEGVNFSDIFKRDKSGRLETMNSIYRPFSLGSFNAMPKAGLVSIFYSQSPEKQAIGQFLFTYGGTANIRFFRQFETIKHIFEPYAQYSGYTRPRIAVNDYFVFDIHDGYDQLDQLRFGLRQLFFSKSQTVFLPALTLDLYSYAFWGARSFTQTIPKAFIDLSINQPSWAFHGDLGWNIQENLLDYGNMHLLWTLSSTFAFGVEFRHRSKFWWRKTIYDNYIVDFARPLEDLLASPMSDGRNTLLTSAHIRLSPRWNLQLRTHHGWGRANEPRYNGAKLDLYTMITGSWQMKLTYEYLENDPYRISYSFKLIK